MKLSILQLVWTLNFVCLAATELSYEECRPGDVLFIKPKVSLEVNDLSGRSQFNKTIESRSESHCFSKCKHVFECKSATFFSDSGSSKCLLKGTNRFGVRNRIKRISEGNYFEKTEGCSRVARERRRVIGMVENAVDCKDVLKQGWKHDGVYLIRHPDQDTYRPIIQRRVDGSVSFSGDWERYKHGFGEVSREFWYGNENIHNLTKNGDNEVIFELQDTNGIFYHPYYQQFAVVSEAENYRLAVGPYEHKYGLPLPPYPYSTDRADGGCFLYHNHMEFSTSDRDNDMKGDGSCSNLSSGIGWWFKDCALAAINNPLFGTYGTSLGLKWNQITHYLDQAKSLKSTEMMVRRK